MVYKLVGIIIYELPKYIYLLSRGGDDYLKITNRNEKVSLGPERSGYVCLWPYTSRLHAAGLIPWLGQAVLCKALREWSFSVAQERHVDEEVEMTIVVGHRGGERIGHLLTTIRSLSAQKDIKIECIVVEQDQVSIIKDYLPEWVRHIHQREDDSDSQYNRSAAFNYGVRFARGKILLLHDNDMIVPENYCREIVRIMSQGYEAVNPKRFVFYLNKRDSSSVMLNVSGLGRYQPEYIVQNLEAGGSIAISKEAYLEIGGMDEGFVGWGGEDNEFWDRASYLRKWIWGYLPVIHLWHESQGLKKIPNNQNIRRARELLEKCRMERIRRLRLENRMEVG